LNAVFAAGLNIQVNINKEVLAIVLLVLQNTVIGEDL
jgi:hypothetical protein